MGDDFIVERHEDISMNCGSTVIDNMGDERGDKHQNSKRFVRKTLTGRSLSCRLNSQGSLVESDTDFEWSQKSTEEEDISENSYVQDSVSNAASEVRLATPSKNIPDDLFPWTPTANLKMLSKAASPEIRYLDLMRASRSGVAVRSGIPKVKTGLSKQSMNCLLTKQTLDHVTVDTLIRGEVVEELTSRKDKSLFLLCQR